MPRQYEMNGKTLEDSKDVSVPTYTVLQPNNSVEPLESKMGDTDAKKEKTAVIPMVGVAELFRFADGKDCALMVIGTICACAIGAAGPMMMIIFGNMSDIFINNAFLHNLIEDFVANITARCASATVPPCPSFLMNLTADDVIKSLPNITYFLRSINETDLADAIETAIKENTWDLFTSEIQKYSLIYTYIGCGILLVGYLQMMCWHTAAYNQSQRIHVHLFRSILKQDITWFDTHEIGELNTRLTDDVDQIEKGIGDKLALFFQYVSAFFAGFIVGFIFGWKLTLVIVAVSPLLAISGGFMAKIVSSFTQKELEAYAKAGAVAEEVLGSIRTVVAFGGQERETKRYSVNLFEAQNFGVKKGIVGGIGMACVFLVMFGSYALAFWYGSGLVRDEDYTAGSMMVVFFSVLMGAFSIGAASPNIQDFANARGAAHAIYNIIDLVPSIDSSSPDGIKEGKLAGNIKFENVVFRYPARTEVQVLNGLTLEVNVGQTVALVGSSGCGKSTCVQLLQRFYDLQSGRILIDETDIRDFNIKWLRQHIGVVSQEPILFGTTIAENIRYGREDVTVEEMTRAAKEANAHDFISMLPQKYETLVGERGAQLSGGQKQRIAIARALVRDPIMLLLDEATSALDTESESTVQAALDKARLGRTTIVIAHRLSTIQTADIIAGVCDGVIVEQGSHDELMKRGGVYCNLVTNQKMMNEDENDEDSELNKYHEKSLVRALSHPGEKVNFERLRSASIKSSDNKSSENEKEEKLSDPPVIRILKLNSPEWLFIIIGCLSSIVMGLVQPAFALLFSELLGVFQITDLALQEKKCNDYSALFAVIGVVAGVANLGMGIMFAKSGEYLTTRLRQMTFSSLVRQEIAYFDDHLNSTGALCSRLATDASAVKGATGSRLASLIQSFASIGGGIVIGFIYSWQLTLVVLAFAPFMLIGGFIEMRVFAGGRGERNKKMEEAAKVATEAIENIRTVAALTKEDKFHDVYCSLIAVPYSENRRKAHLIGAAYAFSQSIVFFANAAGFSFGGYLVREELLDYTSMFKVFSAIIFGAMAAGQASSFAPDYGKAKLAAARLFAIFDRVPPIDSSSEEGMKPDKITGSVVLRNVHFTYPTRPDIEVLKGVDICVNPGQVVALVGSSGCGKSTIVQLIERFYDPHQGQVLIDGYALTDLHLQWIRSQIGIVSQEPVLFDCSIQENITYGDNFREVSMDEVINAARQANIHSFIETLPQGYDTNVGDKGTQLSGGQKQRVAIARALIRSPKILLLDEATSALDTESEKVVQEALERAQLGRTSIVIAHRLSTIQNADCIVVLHRGKIVEVGKHLELMNKKGYYFKLNTKQTDRP